jgi:hypothetical protein
MAKSTLLILAATTTMSFLLSYFMELTLGNAEQFLGVACVVLLDGFFGIIAGIKREGFKTFKALLSVLRTLGVWWIILGAILAVEKGFTGCRMDVRNYNNSIPNISNYKCS